LLFIVLLYNIQYDNFALQTLYWVRTTEGDEIHEICSTGS